MALLHRVDPFPDITNADFTLIRQWLAARQNCMIGSTIMPRSGRYKRHDA